MSEAERELCRARTATRQFIIRRPIAKGTSMREADPLVVDARGLACPLPVIELAKAMDNVAISSRIELLATDPAAQTDVPVWCRMQRQKLHSQSHQDDVWSFVVERLR